jgi:DNA-binding transcriptional ArsR family regulator
MIAHTSSIPLNEEIIYLIEALKVESYWNSQNFTLTLQNKNLPFLNHIEKIVKDLDIKPSKRILLKIKLIDNSIKEDTKIKEKKKELNFHIEKSPFDKSKVKAVVSLPYKKEYRVYIINKNNKEKIKIKVLRSKILYESKLQCFLYKDLRFPTKKILNFLDEYCGEKKEFHVEDCLFNFDAKKVVSAFSALVDCEGSINWYGLKRIIRIRMRNKKYLEQWSSLLSKHCIGNKFRKNKNEWEINISGWEDFNKLEKMGFKLYNSEKAERWKRMIKEFKRNQISRGSYKEFYMSKLKEIDKRVTAKELSIYLKKSKRVANHYLSKLEKEGLISCDRQNWPYLYFISTSSVR